MWRDAEEQTCWRISCPSGKVPPAHSSPASLPNVGAPQPHKPSRLKLSQERLTFQPASPRGMMSGMMCLRRYQPTCRDGEGSKSAMNRLPLRGWSEPSQAKLGCHAVWRQPAQTTAQSSSCCGLQLGQARSCTLLHPTFDHINASDSAAHAMRHTTHRVHAQGQHRAKLLAALCTRRVTKANSMSRGTALQAM